MFPIGAKIKYFNDKINIKAHLQIPSFDKELDEFYHNIPLKKEPFEKSKTLMKGKKKEVIKETNFPIEKIKPKNKTKKVIKS